MQEQKALVRSQSQATVQQQIGPNQQSSANIAHSENNMSPDQSDEHGNNSNSNSYSQHASAVSNPHAIDLNQKKSLLTSTGCGPDGSQIKTVQSGAATNGVGKKKPVQQEEVDQSQHIRKFTSGIVFNAIERVVVAGQSLMVRQ